MSKKPATNQRAVSKSHPFLIHPKHMTVKKLWAALAIVLTAIIIIGISFLLLAGKAAANYNAGLADQKQQIASVIDTLAEVSHGFKEESSDIKQLQKQVEDTNNDLQALQPVQLSTVPIGSLLSADYKKAATHQAGYGQNIQDLKNTSYQLVGYMHYQQKLHSILANAAIKKPVNDEASAKAAQQAWQSVHQQLSDLKTDDQVLHSTTVYLAKDVKQLANTFALVQTAYKKEDNGAIEKHSKTITDTIQKIHTYAESLASYRLDLDYKVTKVIENLLTS